MVTARGDCFDEMYHQELTINRTFHGVSIGGKKPHRPSKPGSGNVKRGSRSSIKPCSENKRSFITDNMPTIEGESPVLTV